MSDGPKGEPVPPEPYTEEDLAGAQGAMSEKLLEDVAAEVNAAAEDFPDPSQVAAEVEAGAAEKLARIERLRDVLERLDMQSERILVTRATMAEKTHGGLFIPDTAKNPPHVGVVVKSFEDVDLEPGDTVAWQAYAGAEVEIERETFVVLHVRDIFFRIRPRDEEE